MHSYIATTVCCVSFRYRRYVLVLYLYTQSSIFGSLKCLTVTSKHLQDDLESLRHSTARDLAALATELAKSEEERRHLSDLVVVLRQRVSNETSTDEQVNTERKLLEQRLEEAHLHLADIKTSWSDKIASLETQVS